VGEHYIGHIGPVADMAMGLVHPWVGLGQKFSTMKCVGLGWVGFSCQKLIFFFTTIIIPLRKSLTVIYYHSLHPTTTVRRCVLLTYRFLIYVADLNYIMLLFDVGLGWVCKVMGWVGLGWVTKKWTHGHVCPVGRPTGFLSASFQKHARLVGRLGSGPRLGGWIGSGVRVGAGFQINARLVGRLGSGSRLVTVD